MISLELRGVLQNKSGEKFQRRKPWAVNLPDFNGFPKGTQPRNSVRDPD